MSADRLDELRGLHMPPMDLSAVVAEVCAALAIGLLAAWLIAGAIKLVTARRVPPETVALRRLDAVVEATDPLAARAEILQDYAATVEGEGDWLSRLDARFGGVFTDGAGQGLRDALYRPGASFDVAAFDTAVRAALQRAGR